jgi:hypothetical protein
MASGESKPGGFTVTDRRTFGQGDGGEPRPEAPAPAPAAPPAAPASETAAVEGEETGTAALPQVDFHTFVLSLGSSALLHLGELEHPDAGGPHKDLPLAKHTIDILAMLEEKTKGNLTTAESKLISSLLYDLRLRYVEASKGA